MEPMNVLSSNVEAVSSVIKKYTLTNKNGMQLDIINLGGIITALTAPDKNGKYEDIVLGFPKADDYADRNPYYFGAIIGRYGNRIANSRFVLEGEKYEIVQNEEFSSLHGGKAGFHTKFWDVEHITDAHYPSLKLTYTSTDGEEGFPGTLTATVFYTLTDDDALEIFYEAETDQTTVINLTQHTYFNLSGNFNKTVTEHEVQINAAHFLPVTENMIPTGEQRQVKDTPFDFTALQPVGKEINSDNEQLRIGNGYDHTWVLNGEGLRSAAKVFEPFTGRLMEVLTDQPGVQFYSGNFLDGKFANKSGGKSDRRTGFCMETQHFPDSPNQASFPSTVLKPGARYQTKTVYKFSVKCKSP